MTNENKVISKYATVEQKVKAMFKKYPPLINSNDMDLMLMIWKEIDGVDLELTPEERKRLTNATSIHKIRQKIQREEPYWCPSQIVLENREDLNNITRQYMRGEKQ